MPVLSGLDELFPVTSFFTVSQSRVHSHDVNNFLIFNRDALDRFSSTLVPNLIRRS